MNIVEQLKDLFTTAEAKERKQKLLSESEVFCMTPWIQLHAQTNGKVSPCCMSFVTNGNELGDLRENPNLDESWKTIEENIRTVQQQCPSVIFGVNATVSIFNVLHIPAFYKYMVEQQLVLPGRLNLYLLFSPEYFNITNLTPALKQKVVQQFEELERSYLNTLADSANIKNHIQTGITYMQSAEGMGQKEFQYWVEAVEKSREENFVSTFPELTEMMVEGSAV